MILTSPEIEILGEPDKFGAVAFQRLLNTQIANILSSRYIKKPIEVDGDDLMVHDEFEGSDGKLQNVGKCRLLAKDSARRFDSVNTFRNFIL